MNRTFAAFFLPAEYQNNTERANSVQQIYADWERLKVFTNERLRDAGDVSELLALRTECESTYAMRLERISQLQQRKFIQQITVESSPLSKSSIHEEVQCFKNSCGNKAKQAQEIAENVQQDCIDPLNQLIQAQQEELTRLSAQARVETEKLHSIDKEIKAQAVQYFKSAKDCDELIQKYQSVKFASDVSFQARNISYQQMTHAVAQANADERSYKATVDQANAFLLSFRQKIKQYCDILVSFERPKVELIHSAINSFVVFEMSAEMNNKYDVGNFAKILETFDPDQEQELVVQFLKGSYMPDPINQPKFDFVEFQGSLDFRKIDALKAPVQSIELILQDNTLSLQDLDQILSTALTKIFANQFMSKSHIQVVLRMNQEGYSQHFYKQLKSKMKEVYPETAFWNLQELFSSLLTYETQTKFQNIGVLLEIIDKVSLDQQVGKDKKDMLKVLADHMVWSHAEVYTGILMPQILVERLQLPQSTVRGLFGGRQDLLPWVEEYCKRRAHQLPGKTAEFPIKTRTLNQLLSQRKSE